MKLGMYFKVKYWMVAKLKLEGDELDAYAIVYGYSAGEGWCNDAERLVARWLRLSDDEARDVLGCLVKRGIVVREEVNGRVKYRALPQDVDERERL